MTETEEQLKNFLDLYSLKNLVHESTCYKSQTARCIDLVLRTETGACNKRLQLKLACQISIKGLLLSLKLYDYL